MLEQLVKTTGKKSGKNRGRKYDRNRVKCKLYRERGRRERNKIRKLRRHLKRQPEDHQAVEVLRSLDKAA